jgi:tetratricopeptide (TPR) repeat protein
MPEKRYWGPHNEYGPFSTQADGWPNRGEVIRHYRKLRPMSAEELGIAYGKLVNSSPIDERWIQKMEKENTVPKDERRRRILANILGIPPILLGFGVLSDLQPKEEGSPSASTTPINALSGLVGADPAGRYDKMLNLLWKLDYTSTAQTSLTDIEGMIQELNHVSSFVSGNEQIKLLELLCGFYPLASTIYADLRLYDKAAEHADAGVTLANKMGNSKLIAVNLYQRGFVNLQRGSTLDQLNTQYLNAAIDDFTSALPLSIPRVEAAILMDRSQAYAYKKQGRAAYSDIDAAWNIVDRGKLVDGTFIDSFANLSKARYDLGRAATLVAMKKYDDAEDLLEKSALGIPSDQTRRHAWIAILQAKVYYGQKNYVLATSTAMDALRISKGINSVNSVQEIQQLHTRLSSTSFADSRDFRSLGASLLLS